MMEVDLWLGKTSLVAAFVKDFVSNNPNHIVITHFIGAAPGSTNVRNTLTRLCNELWQLCRIK